MRIAYVHYLRPDDTACHHARQFAAAARALGHHVEVYATNGTQAPARTHGFEHPDGEVRRRLGRHLRAPRELGRNVRYAWTEWRTFAAARPDVLLVRDHHLTASCVPVSRWLRVPLVLEMNAPAAEARLYQPEQWQMGSVAERLERWKLHHAARVSVVSGALRDHLVARHGIAASKFTVVSNGADPEVFRPDLPPDPVVSARRSDDVVIGFVGSFQAWHGSALLGEMIRLVARARPNVRFLLVGDGPGAGALRAATAELDGRLTFVGSVPHERVPALVAGLDVGVIADCGFYMSPLKVLEWMCAGRAVVAPAYAPLHEIIDDGVHGLLFRPRDRDSLVSAVLRLVDDAGLRSSIGSAAAARVRNSLSWRHNAASVLAACAEARAGA